MPDGDIEQGDFSGKGRGTPRNRGRQRRGQFDGDEARRPRLKPWDRSQRRAGNVNPEVAEPIEGAREARPDQEAAQQAQSESTTPQQSETSQAQRAPEILPTQTESESPTTDREMRSRILSILNKHFLNIENDTEMGEIADQFTAEEVRQLDILFQGAKERANQSPLLHELDAKIEQYRKENAALDQELKQYQDVIRKGTGKNIVLDTWQAPRVFIPENYMVELRKRRNLEYVASIHNNLKNNPRDSFRFYPAREFADRIDQVLAAYYPEEGAPQATQQPAARANEPTAMPQVAAPANERAPQAQTQAVHPRNETPPPPAEPWQPSMLDRPISAFRHGKDHDYPATITGYMGKGPDGRDYFSTEEGGGGVPLDEIDAPPEALNELRLKIESSSTPPAKPLMQGPDASVPTPPTQEPTVNPAREPRGSRARYVDTTAQVTREQLANDPTVTKMREVINQVRGNNSSWNDIDNLQLIAEQIREVGVWNNPEKAKDPGYQALKSAMENAGIPADAALLATEYLLDEAKRTANGAAENGSGGLRRSVPDTVEHTNDWNVAFSPDAEEMNMVNEDRNTGYQDIRAAQIVSDYLLDTYDPTARSRWAEKSDPENVLAERQQYNELLLQVLQGQVPEDKRELADKLISRMAELVTLSPDEAFAQYKGLTPEDAERTRASIARWRERENIEPYDRGSLDLMAMKGLILLKRRGEVPERYKTTEIFYTKALKEKGGSRPTTETLAEKRTTQNSEAETKTATSPNSTEASRGKKKKIETDEERRQRLDARNARDKERKAKKAAEEAERDSSPDESADTPPEKPVVELNSAAETGASPQAQTRPETEPDDIAEKKPMDYETNIATGNPVARKDAQTLTQREIEARDAENRPQFRGNIFNRAGQALRFAFSRQGLRHAWNAQTKEYRRLIGNERNYNALRDANIGVAATPEIMDLVREIRTEQGAVVNEHRLLRESPIIGQIVGESIQITDVTIRTDFLDNILRPAVADLQSSITPAAREEAETHIQRNLSEFVARHQDNNQITRYFGGNRGQYGQQSEFFASDIAELAQRIIDDGRAHDLATKAIDEHIKLRFFNQAQGQVSEVAGGPTDRLYEWSKRGRIRGRIINAATIGITASAATFLARSGIRAGIGVSHVVATPLAGMAASAVYKNFQERHLFNQEMKSVARDMESDLHAGDNSPRRAELERVLSPIFARSSELINGGGQDALLGVQRQSIAEILRRGNISEMQSRYGEIRARLELPSLENRGNGVFRNLGLISYDIPRQNETANPLIRHVDTGRLALIRQMLELRNAIVATGENPEERVGAWSDQLIATKDQQRWAFIRQREFRALRKAGGAAILGGLMGLGFQEGLAVAGRGIENLGINIQETPYAGAFFGKGQTVIEKIAHINKPDSTPSIDTVSGLYKTGGTVSLSEHIQMQVDANHTANIINTQTGEHLASNTMIIEPNGHIKVVGDLPDSVRAILNHDHIAIEAGPDTSTTIFDPAPATEHVQFMGHDTIIPKGTEWTTGPDGKADLVLSSDHSKILLHDVDLSGAEGGVKQVFGDGGEWLKHAREIDHREWYSYDQPGSQGNELGFDTYKNGDSVTFDMTRMGLGYQHGLNPNPIDVQQAIANHEVGFAISNPADPQRPIWVSDGADGTWDGKVTLNATNANAEIYKMVVNHDALTKLPDGNIATELNGRQDVFSIGSDGKMGTIEAGRLVPGPNGTALQTFATIRGSFSTPTTIGSIPAFDTPALTETLHTFDLIPPAPDMAPPIIPIPFYPRRDLEPPILGPKIAPIPPIIPPPAYGRPYGMGAGTGSPISSPTATDVRRPAEEILDEKEDETIPPITTVETSPRTTTARTVPTAPATETLRAAGRAELPSDPTIRAIQEHLAAETIDISHYELDAPTLVKYVESLPLQGGATIQELKASIEGENLSLQGTVNAAGQNSTFSATITVGHDGKIKIVNQDIQLAFLHKLAGAGGQIENFMDNLDANLSSLINKQTPGWEVGGFTLNGDKLGVEFVKNETLPASGDNIYSVVSNEANSPIERTDRQRAIELGYSFVNSREISDAQAKGGFDQIQAEQMYLSIINWLKSKNIPETELDDPSLEPTTYAYIIKNLKTFNITEKDEDVKTIANLLAKFVRDKHIELEKGDADLNAFALAFLYDTVKDLSLR